MYDDAAAGAAPDAAADELDDIVFLILLLFI
jgi:hypothetical protein